MDFKLWMKLTSKLWTPVKDTRHDWLRRNKNIPKNLTETQISLFLCLLCRQLLGSLLACYRNEQIMPSWISSHVKVLFQQTCAKGLWYIFGNWKASFTFTSTAQINFYFGIVWYQAEVKVKRAIWATQSTIKQ